ncbi:hypothetical protein LVJ82_17985 [Vitreoscilla massiliensis]|uniref:Uncharacterized protein n=1 Tax=Vitreoscilla massiliensis TaxID=1689272 RepID=A0ABY4E0I3_9NEIS|nr:hypothetical protein [Vitreoscilla massiliensis]UOO89306.1 hypothetical protein LVJ82_17985 [Vitreoscilla massiliensis]
MASSCESWLTLWCNAFPASVQAEVPDVCQRLQATLRAHPRKSSIDSFQISLASACLNIPERVYFFASPLKYLANKHLAGDVDTDAERAILACMYNRHHNGHVREHALRLLLQQTMPDFAIPHLLRLAGEYVAAIVYLLAPLLNNAVYAQAWTGFLAENPRFYQQTQSHLLSYWNAYYRQ